MQKLNKELDRKFKWKSSYKYDRSVKGGRVSIDCPEPEVALDMFPGLAKSKNGTKMALKLETDDDIYNEGLHGKSYRYGASANLMAPASITWNSSGQLSFSFKYQIHC